jgi:hypothetical protein
VCSPTFSPKVAKNDFVNQINSFAWGWHILGCREFKASASESFEMITALSLKMVQQHFIVGHRSIVSNFAHGVRQKFQLTVQPFHEARDIFRNLEVLGFGTKAYKNTMICCGQICPPLMAISFVLLKSVFKLTLYLLQFGNKVSVSLRKNLLGIILSDHVFQLGATLFIALQA